MERNELSLVRQAILHVIEVTPQKSPLPSRGVSEACRISRDAVDRHLGFLRKHGCLTWSLDSSRRRQFIVILPPATPEERRTAEAYLRNPVDPQTLVTAATERTIVRRYNSPERPTLRALAKETGWSVRRVRKVLEASPDVTLRGRGRVGPDEKTITRFETLYNGPGQLSIQAIVAKTGWSYGAVHRALDASDNVTLRRPGIPRGARRT
ncbi:helix-turn-helix domain-containing protein [Streptomyces niveus]|uniref:helix-turn-helix domain-containing protein n=1 Tax=Streptomyces niveus TaxID=193462 RepID=UPI0036765B2F